MTNKINHWESFTENTAITNHYPPIRLMIASQWDFIHGMDEVDFALTPITYVMRRRTDCATHYLYQYISYVNQTHGNKLWWDKNRNKAISLNNNPSENAVLKLGAISFRPLYVKHAVWKAPESKSTALLNQNSSLKGRVIAISFCVICYFFTRLQLTFVLLCVLHILLSC